MNDFDRAIAAVLDHEGDYSNDPADPGGETRWGISKRSYPHINIAALTQGEACSIYEAEFWRKPHIDALPWPVSGKVLDLAVNLGRGRAIRMLQAALCKLGYWVDMDGAIGPNTIKACKAANATAVVNALCIAQAAHYERLIEKNPTLAKFRRGWAKRAGYRPV